ncbi:S8 family serine peptidase [Isoptericola sp. NPDC057559]|uniref:S8 family serine peptidase n=1 Tax=Isoptericola sp. NPDC057559 TaxID=3346168 RepID=UPI0036ACE275
MRPPVRAGLAATAVSALLAAGAAPALAGPTTDPDAATPAASAAPDGATSTLTLVTGDVVHVATTGDGKPAVTVEPAAGTTRPAQTFEVGDDLYVVPAAAQPYLASGALDRELFNVTGLVADGYDDEAAIPVIAQYDRKARTAAAAAPRGSEKVLELTSIGGAALRADTDDAATFWGAITAAPAASARTAAAPGTFAGGIAKLWLDGRAEATLDVSVPLVGAPEAWAAGHDGEGATVAVLDTGVDAAHPDLADVVTTTESFVPGETVQDVHGHGTHVASTVAGSGAADGGVHRGVAPGADVAVGKVLSDEGYGLDSWIIAGMEWASRDVDADVVSMSLGDDSRHDQTDPVAQAVNNLTEETDALFVIAAGNAGGEGTVSSPGTADAALTVAATDDQDELAYFSSRGPRGLDDGLKPDLAAPGVDITAARSQYAAGEGPYQTMSGTSMATPHVAGAAAILAAAYPGWDAARIKDALMSSAVGLDGYTPYEVGTGRLDVPAALDGVDATGSVHFGRVAWGDGDPAPQTRTITYANDTDADVALDLASTTTGPDGDVALVRLSEAHLVVPAHGTASVEATASFADATAAGKYTGQVVATTADGSVAARTATGLTRETEHYDLDVTVLGPDGEPVAAEVSLYRYGTQWITPLVTDPGTGAAPTQRVEPGEFTALTSIRYADTDGTDRLYWLADPQVTVSDGDVRVVLDARDAHPVELDTPRPSADYDGRVQWFHDSGIGGQYATFSASVGMVPGAEVWVNETGDVAGGDFALTSRWSRTAPLLSLQARTPRPAGLEPVYQAGSARLDGKVDLKVVTAGTGTPDEIAAVAAKGKALLVTNDPDVSPWDRAAAADAAGAALLVVVNDGPGVLYDPAGATDVPVVSLTADEGGRLLAGAAGKGARLTGRGVEFPDYSYDVVRTWQGSVPADLSVAPREKDLAQVTDRLADPDPRLTFVSRYDCPEYSLGCLGVTQPRMSGDEQLVYVSPVGEEQGWYATATSTNGWEVRDDRRRYPAGSRTTIDWFGVTAPHQGPGYWKSRADGDWFQLNVPPASSTGELTGGFGDDQPVTSRLFQDDTLVREMSGQAIQRAVPAVDGTHTYRFEQDTALDPAVWGYSSRTSTVWTFQADQAELDGSPLPIVSLGYDVAGRDLSGAVRRNTPVRLDVTAALPPEGAVGAGTVTGVAVEVSFDAGATWRSVAAKPSGEGRWTVRFDAPKRATSVSLRTTAQDDAGSSVTQEVVKAFGLR